MGNRALGLVALVGVLLMLAYPSVVMWAATNHAELLGLEKIPLVLGGLLVLIAGVLYLLRTLAAHHPRPMIED